MKRLIFVTALITAFAGCTIEETEEELTSQAYSVGSVYVGCYIDTPAFDTYSPEYCTAAGRNASTVSFKLFPHQPPSYVAWSVTDIFGNPKPINCSGVVCNAPIQPGEELIGHVLYYVVNGTPTQGAAATAAFEW